MMMFQSGLHNFKEEATDYGIKITFEMRSIEAECLTILGLLGENPYSATLESALRLAIAETFKKGTDVRVVNRMLDKAEEEAKAELANRRAERRAAKESAGE